MFSYRPYLHICCPWEWSSSTSSTSTTTPTSSTSDPLACELLWSIPYRTSIIACHRIQPRTIWRQQWSVGVIKTIVRVDATPKECKYTILYTHPMMLLLKADLLHDCSMLWNTQIGWSNNSCLNDNRLCPRSVGWWMVVQKKRFGGVCGRAVEHDMLCNHVLFSAWFPLFLFHLTYFGI